MYFSEFKNKYGYPQEELDQVIFPQSEIFDIYSINTDKEGNSVNVVFNKTLDYKQNLNGLYNIKDFPLANYSISNNILKIRLTDNENDVKETTLRIYDGILSSDGQKLSKEKSENDSLFFSKISLDFGSPKLAFISSGNIIPTESGKNVLFEAQALKGVIVRIIKIYQNNTEQFLQNNNISGENSLAQVGELVARKTIFFEDMGSYDLSKKNVFGINLSDFINVDKGAIYNVRLSYNYDLSAYPVDERNQLTKEEILADESLKTAEENKQVSESSYYYFTDNSNANYDWRSRNNPAKTADRKSVV